MKGAKSPMSGGMTIPLGRPAGIPLKLHLTFFLLLFLILPNPNPVRWGAIVLSVFLCVVLHEYGHALTARRFGIGTRDITLYPFGGLAMLRGQPKPIHEFWIALAGPAVNVAIALVLLPLLYIFQDGPSLRAMDPLNPDFLQALFLANVILPVFNMIPAYPMDGGRVLRSLLSMLMREDKAGVISARIGQGLALCLGLFGVLSGQFMLAIISILIFFGASQEVRAAPWRPILSRSTVGQAMISPVQTLEPEDTLEMARQLMMISRQSDLPVTRHGEVLGILTGQNLEKALREHPNDSDIGPHVKASTRSLAPDAPLERAIELFYAEPESILVMLDGNLHGLLTREGLSVYIQEQRALLANS